MLLDSIKAPRCCNVLCNTTLKIVAIYTFVKQCQCFTTDQMILSMLQQSPFWITNALFLLFLLCYSLFTNVTLTLLAIAVPGFQQHLQEIQECTPVDCMKD